ncbi:hypothetical protein [uncultured Duncaniella sp.]|uniref:hypothetical protein n=1 Tax=uncultured Duncaniella sp. TaxID=2768039 RepID=UPI00260661FF|nr:hypothetical protein [uncultured Duncaniella sp.]
MLELNKLMALSESSGGFTGGSYVDELPDMSLDEAVNMLPVIIVESQIELTDSRMHHNNLLVEATVSAAAMGTEPDFGPIVEMSFEDIKKKIKAFFDKIIKFLKSIINKLSLQIDKMRMSGHQLYEKYKDSKLLQGKSFKDLTFNGYKIMGKDDIFADTKKFESEPGIRELIKKAIPGCVDYDEFGKTYKAGIAVDSKAENPLVKATEKLSGITQADRQVAMAKLLTGEKSLTAGDWEGAIKKKLYGEKVDIAYGKDGFTLDALAAMLKDPADLNAIKEAYARVEKAAHEFHDKIQRAIDDLSSQSDKLESAKGDNSAKTNRNSLVSSYYSAYMGVVSDSYAVINKVQSLKYNFQKTRYDQAKQMFGKMLSWKSEKKDNNDASDVDDDGEIEAMTFMI